MRHLTILLLTLFTIGSLQAQLYRKTDTNNGDKPSGVMRLKIPPRPDAEGWRPPMPDPEPEDLPFIKQEPLPEPEDDPPEPPAPTFFGEIIPEQFIFLIDVSGSMATSANATTEMEDADGNVMTNPSRMDLIRAELIRMIKTIPDEYEFDLIAFPNADKNSTYTWRGKLVIANDATRAQAIAWVESLYPCGGTPMDKALFVITHEYPEDIIDKMFVLCDGFFEHPSAFPSWWAPFKTNGCVFVGVHIGASGAAAMMKLAMSVGGKYKQVG